MARKHIADSHEMTVARFEFYSQELDLAYAELDRRIESGDFDPLDAWELTDDLNQTIDAIDLGWPWKPRSIRGFIASL